MLKSISWKKSKVMTAEKSAYYITLLFLLSFYCKYISEHANESVLNWFSKTDSLNWFKSWDQDESQNVIKNELNS